MVGLGLINLLSLIVGWSQKNNTMVTVKSRDMTLTVTGCGLPYPGHGQTTHPLASFPTVPQGFDP